MIYDFPGVDHEGRQTCRLNISLSTHFPGFTFKVKVYGSNKHLDFNQGWCYRIVNKPTINTTGLNSKA